MQNAGLLRETTLNGMRGVCSGRSETNADWVTVVCQDGRRFVLLDRYDQIDVEQLVPVSDRSPVSLRGPVGAHEQFMIELLRATHTPFALWCEMCVQACGTSDWDKSVSD